MRQTDSSENSQPNAASMGVSYIRAKKTHRIARVPIMMPCLIWVRQGTKHLMWETGEAWATSKSLMILPANSEFYITNQATPSGYTAEVVYFSDAFIQQFLQQNLSQNTNSHSTADENYCVDIDKHTQTALTNLVDSINTGAPESIQQGYADVVLRSLSARGLLSSWVQLENTLSDKVSRCIMNQPSKDWSVDDLARQFNQARRHLAKEGKSFREICDSVRMGIALTSLQTTEMSVAEITTQVGYSCPSQFTAKFKRRFGLSPTALRAVL